MGDWSDDLAGTFLSSVPTTLLHLSLDGVVLHANPEAERILGRPALEGIELASLVDERDRDRFGAFLHRCAADATGASAFLPSIGVECGDVTRRMDAACRAHPAIWGIRGLALVLVDTTERERQLAELAYRATHDSLSGLGNRSLLMSVCEQIGVSLRGSVLVLDLDGFKHVNDTHGHSAGDQVLTAVSARIRSLLPEDCSAYRLGGDEFAVLLPGRSARAGLLLGHALRLAVADPVELVSSGGAAASVSVTVTIGAADLDSRGIPDAVQRADLALYDGKAQGGSRVVVHDPAQRTVRQRGHDLQAEMLRLAADNARLQREAREDAGTGLPNLRALLEELDLVHQVSVTDRATYGLVFIDLDHFGLVNKRHGDRAGDDVLRRVARTLAASTRTTDRLYRKGGEELVVVVPDADLDETATVAERLRAALEQERIPHGGREDLATVTASLGVAIGGCGVDLDARSVMERGALCMLRAKDEGRNRVARDPLDLAIG